MKLSEITLPAAAYVCRNLRTADAREHMATQSGDVLDPDRLAMLVCGDWKGRGPSWAASLDGRPIALGGALRAWPGVWSLWMFATDEFPLIGLPLTKFVKRVLLANLKEWGHRVEARSIEGHDHAHRWLKALGATEECRHKGYGRNGEDFIVFTLACDSPARKIDSGDFATINGG